MRQLPLIAPVLWAVPGLFPAVQEPSPARSPRVRASLPVPSEISDWRLADLDGAPGSELLVVLVDGTIETIRFDRATSLSDRVWRSTIRFS